MTVKLRDIFVQVQQVQEVQEVQQVQEVQEVDIIYDSTFASVMPPFLGSAN